ncbi:hypothetical protein EO93_11615 [Methanosarcina sp. 1.H.A.2.2]|nr:hypothetical protein EO93_11615 [Methanosarcina sp. 1.H.A.2.2]
MQQYAVLFAALKRTNLWVLAVNCAQEDLIRNIGGAFYHFGECGKSRMPRPLQAIRQFPSIAPKIILFLFKSFKYLFLNTFCSKDNPE